MAKKYLRGLQYTTGTNGRDIPLFMRVCYEFWGYCINNNNPLFQVTAATNASPIAITTSANHGLSTGQLVGVNGVLGNTNANGQFIITVTGSTTFTLNSSTGNGTYTGGGFVSAPGGMPNTPVNGAAGFFEGTSVVLGTGNDGVTSDLGINFTSLSANFSTSLIGKHITIWSHTDIDSTDNSIYRILNVPNSQQLMLAPFSGGTKDITTLKNNLTSRSALNYRILDFTAASTLAVANGHYWVGTLTGASTVNAGQANSQFQFFIRGGANPFGTMGMVGSPTGSWNGSSFTGSTISESLLTHTNVTFSGVTSGTTGVITLIGDKNFFIGHVRSPNASGSSGVYFNIIVPQRLYTQAQDPNPLAMLVGSNALTCVSATESHTNRFAMVGADGTSRACQLMTKNLSGEGSTSPNNSLPFTVGPNLSSVLTQRSVAGKVIYSDAVISCFTTLGQFSLARAKMREIAFTGSIIPIYHLVGDNGEFIHMGGGLLWPWDGSIMPYNLLPLGS